MATFRATHASNCLLTKRVLVKQQSGPSVGEVVIPGGHHVMRSRRCHRNQPPIEVRRSPIQDLCAMQIDVWGSQEGSAHGTIKPGWRQSRGQIPYLMQFVTSYDFR